MRQETEPVEEFTLSNQTVPQSEIYKAPILSLEIIEGTTEPLVWSINACGLFQDKDEKFIGR